MFGTILPTYEITVRSTQSQAKRTVVILTKGILVY
jgi:hypothetical protein